ncbi:MAG: hypothetical protein JNL90_03975 [Planctomycetes bacterium]|nr:hypothetical protein [Planctomycetota bacterium]
MRSSTSLGRTTGIVAAWLLGPSIAMAQASASDAGRPTIDGRPIPKIWTDEALAEWATPIAGLGIAPGHFSDAEYDRAPIDALRTYPVYHPAREPKGYRDWMKAQGPQPLIEPDRLKTKADWIAAGERVFDQLDTAVARTDDPAALAHFSDPSAFDAARDERHDVVTKEGIVLDYRWVVERDGKLKLSLGSCSSCHTHLMADGSVLKGAPSNFDLAPTAAERALLAGFDPQPPLRRGAKLWQFFGVPWRADDLHAQWKSAPDEIVAAFQRLDDGGPVGPTFDRFNGSPYFTTRMVDLIGVGQRRYLDATGTHVNRGPEDLARYAILVEFADNAVFGKHRFITERNTQLKNRPSDAAAYALGLYLASLEHVASPHPLDAEARDGQSVFEHEGCAQCHPAPLYTSNELFRVADFEPDPRDPATARLHISDYRIDTDPGLALRTRKGTGYYRVPTLRGLWYRELLEHSGSIATLEEWFDRARLEPDYVPSGWRGPGVKQRAVPGHEYGLDLSDEEKSALIAFLRTL